MLYHQITPSVPFLLLLLFLQISNTNAHTIRHRRNLRQKDRSDHCPKLQNLLEIHLQKMKTSSCIGLPNSIGADEKDPCQVFDVGTTYTGQGKHLEIMGLDALKNQYENTETSMCNLLIERILPSILANNSITESKKFPQQQDPGQQNINVRECFELKKSKKALDEMWKSAVTEGKYIHGIDNAETNVGDCPPNTPPKAAKLLGCNRVDGASGGEQPALLEINEPTWWSENEDDCKDRLDKLTNKNYQEARDEFDGHKKNCEAVKGFLRPFLRAQLAKPRDSIVPLELQVWINDQAGIPKDINKGLCHLWSEDLKNPTIGSGGIQVDKTGASGAEDNTNSEPSRPSPKGENVTWLDDDKNSIQDTAQSGTQENAQSGVNKSGADNSVATSASGTQGNAQSGTQSNKSRFLGTSIANADKNTKIEELEAERKEDILEATAEKAAADQKEQWAQKMQQKVETLEDNVL